MTQLAALLLAVPLVAAPQRAAAPISLYAYPAGPWTAALSFCGLSARSQNPLIQQLESAGLEPAGLDRLGLEARAEALRQATDAASKALAREAALLLAAAPAAPDALRVARLRMLAADYAGLIEDHALLGLLKAAAERESQALDEHQRRRLAAAVGRIADSLGRPADERFSLVEAVSALLPVVPTALMTPTVDRLRRSWAEPVAVPAPRAEGVSLRAKVRAVRGWRALKRAAARRLYRPLLEGFRSIMTHAGELARKYITGREMDRHNFRWSVVEGLFKDGDFRGSFGHPVYDGDVEVHSPVIFPAERMRRLKDQKLSIGSDLLYAGRRVEIAKVAVSPMVGVSGMSYPQLSAPSHLSLLFIHLKLAKELGVRQLINTGEGGAGMHLALLEGDASKVKTALVNWNLANGQFEPGSWDEAKLSAFVSDLMRARAETFAEFSPADLARAQIVAQFGSALNGARAPGGGIDLDKLRAVASHPGVAMTQFKLKQAAKRGAKVDPRKVDAIVAALREIPRDKPFKSPELNPEMDDTESVAALVLAAKIVTRKPVSLKFAIGSPADLYAFLKALRDLGALPDHIQVDGRGSDFSPGSGNAPPGANTSLPSGEALIVLDAVLKKLGARERVVVEATGDVLLPIDAIEKLALGADMVSAARLWMGMGLGCAMVKTCANGNCPYGIASKNSSLFGLSLDPRVIGPKGYAAAANWQKGFVQTLAESAAEDWSLLRRSHGLAGGNRSLHVISNRKTIPLQGFYDLEYVASLLEGALTREETSRLVFGGRR